MRQFSKGNLSINLDSLSSDKESFMDRYRGKYQGDITLLWEEVKDLVKDNGSKQVTFEDKRSKPRTSTKRGTKRRGGNKANKETE